MTAAANLATRLEGILGAHRLITAEAELREYAIDGVVPCAIVRPASAQEVAEVVRFAITEKHTIIASGSRSKLELGTPPTRYDLALDMTALHDIAHFDPGDLTLSVDAGMPLCQLATVLGEKGQFLPLAVPCYETSTVAGALASGIDSTLRRIYGTARDFLIGAEFVDGKGALCKSGGRVVKNVTGYDLHKLLIGSLGTLAVITRLNFRTFTLPQAHGGHLACFSNLEGVSAYRDAIEKSGLPLANLETLSPEMVALTAAVLRETQEEFTTDLDAGKWWVYASYEGSEAVVPRIARDLQKLAHEAAAAPNAILDAASDAHLGGVLREAFDWLRWASPSAALFRIVSPQCQPANLADLLGVAHESSLRGALLVRAAAITYFVLLAENEDESALRAMENAAMRVFSLAAAGQGHAALLHAPNKLKSRVNVWGPKRADLGMMQRVKHSFDPQYIFAPGRFVGGI
ncbi:MAG TPA: FAD-binding oxidoreductase [Verrucomicrobiae bacterium]|nr:FAD-binding oxidoreductase [Verrucomicrobiae bacterium]